MRITGTKTLTDTIEDRVVRRIFFRRGAGIFGPVNFERTITYDEKERKSREVIVRNGKRTTIEYIRY